MLTDAMLKRIEAQYRLDAAFSMHLPDSGISLVRWTQPAGQPPREFERDPIDAYLLSLTLQPMHVQSWVDTRQIWAGALGANMIRLIAPGTKTRWRSDGGFDLLHMLIPPQALDALAGAVESLHDDLCAAVPYYVRDELAAGLGRSMVRSIEGNNRYAVPFAAGLTQGLLAHLLGYRRPAPVQRACARLAPRKLRQVQDHIADNLHREIHVRDLAGLAGMSASHFAHAFRESAGTSPHQYLIDIRLERARDLLTAGDTSILRIALDCGYKDASNFAKLFKRRFGQSPQDYRRQPGC